MKLREAAELLARTVGADGARELVIIRHGRMIDHGDDILKNWDWGDYATVDGVVSRNVQAEPMFVDAAEPG